MTTEAAGNDAARSAAPGPMLGGPTPQSPSMGARLGGLFVHDAPLKVLALVLALLMWKLAREQLQSTETFKDVIVDVLELPSDVRLRDAGPFRMDITVSGTRSEIEQARIALERRSRHVGVRIPPIDPLADEGSAGPLNDRALYSFPFASRDIVSSIAPAPVVTWVRIEERSVPISVPVPMAPSDTSLELAEGYPKSDTPTARVTGPSKVVRTLTSIEPDAVNPNLWLERKPEPDLAQQFHWESGFEAWRRQDPLRSQRLLTIAPDTARGTLKYRRTEGREMAHGVQILVPAGSMDAMSRYETVLSGGGEFDPLTARIKLSVRGDKRTLDEMTASPAKWSFAVLLPPPPGPGEPSVENVPVPIRLTFDPTASGGRAGTPSALLDGTPTLLVTLRKR